MIGNDMVCWALPGGGEGGGGRDQDRFITTMTIRT